MIDRIKQWLCNHGVHVGLPMIVEKEEVEHDTYVKKIRTHGCPTCLEPYGYTVDFEPRDDGDDEIDPTYSRASLVMDEHGVLSVETENDE